MKLETCESLQSSFYYQQQQSPVKEDQWIMEPILPWTPNRIQVFVKKPYNYLDMLR